MVEMLTGLRVHGSLMEKRILETTPEQRHIVGILTNQELIKCQTLERQYLQQIRAWHTQFEKKYRRKPKPVDRPGGIVRLQGRCQALKERMEELNNRLATSHGSDYQMIAGSRSDLFDRSGGNRSPAQKAFLNGLASPQ
ncbi:uncharacterized protein PITG_00624 [Phytophthora infestans T30-4]|uniref:Uncharacterized protein n=1 Tax=Phytophthora infestans (strain T30-4) TaxID=403677 RepID=D0MR98_PHYIT|nr:uncharacterized protein PITG_00624 [Phytophthora infestans T30-4]EEY58017.1 hypothetical protein PITG_00624 [Phytophthora infestans T30-4]|eukprot:XP_002909203.1 hypothetical protein PITG_00624 [Phytophthora infestans T30-4]